MPPASVNPTTNQVAVEPPPPFCPEKNATEESTVASVLPITGKGESGERGEESSLPTPTLLSLRSSAVSFSSSTTSSPSGSPSSSITTDTSVASDIHHASLGSDKHAHEKHKVAERDAGLNKITIIATPDSGVDADLNQIDITTITTASTSASPLPSTPGSSSSTSLPAPTPYDSSTPASTSPSTTNVNDPGVDSNGPLSLLRPRPQITNQNLNVKFAPLPELAPRKRKSNTPLGMAARSQLARRRRMMYQDPYDDDGMDDDAYRARRFYPPEISEEGEMKVGVDGVQEQQSGTKKKAKKEKNGEYVEKEKKVKKEGEQEDEVPLAALAKKMGRAGKHFWRKMASSGKIERDGAGEDEKKVATEPIAVSGTSTSSPGSPEPQEGEGRGQGGVWVEKVGEKLSEIQEMRLKGPAEVEPSLHQAISTPLPPSTPDSPTDDTPKTTFPPQSEGLLEVGTRQEEGPTLDSKIDALPTTPSILVSAA